MNRFIDFACDRVVFIDRYAVRIIWWHRDLLCFAAALFVGLMLLDVLDAPPIIQGIGGFSVAFIMFYAVACLSHDMMMCTPESFEQV